MTAGLAFRAELERTRRKVRRWAMDLRVEYAMLKAQLKSRSIDLDFSTLLKCFYASVRIRDLIMQDSPFMALCKKN